jgi:hypothetical protein
MHDIAQKQIFFTKLAELDPDPDLVVKFPDPDPTKRSGSDRIRIRIRNTGLLMVSSSCYGNISCCCGAIKLQPGRNYPPHVWAVNYPQWLGLKVMLIQKSDNNRGVYSPTSPPPAIVKYWPMTSFGETMV